MRKLVLAVSLLLLSALLFAFYALAARFVLHGPVTATSLHEAVERESRSAGGIFEEAERCRPTQAQATWTCSVYDRSGSGTVDYRVRVRRGSCFDGRRIANHGEGGMPRRIDGCVYLWQWTLLDLL